MYDCVIIGAGAAGVSAALTLKLLKKNFLLIGSKTLSEKISRAEKIKNYPGLYSASGGQLREAFLNQLKGENIAVTEGRVNGVYPAEEGYLVDCGKQVYPTKTVILATGAEAVRPVEGEREYLGRGVSYCAACDGFLYRGKSIAVAVEGEEQLEEVQLLKSYAERVHLLTLGGSVAGAEGRLLKIEGAARADKVITDAGEISVDGVFVLKSAAAADALVHGLKCSGGAVEVNRDTSTNLKGVFAAGDCTGRPYQYAKAAGEGNVAAHSVFAYLGAK